MQHSHLDGLKRNITRTANITAGAPTKTVASRGYTAGTIRTYAPGEPEAIKHRLQPLGETPASLVGAEATATFNDGSPPVRNDESLRITVDEALANLKMEAVDKGKPYLFGEDFSFYNKLAPSYFVFFGSRNEDKGYTGSLHTSTFNFDEKVLIDVADYYESILNSV